jgi:GAF domain-containing protein
VLCDIGTPRSQKRARALVDAHTLVIWLQEGDELGVAAATGEAPRHLGEPRIPLVGSVSGEVARSRVGERIGAAGAALRLSLDRLGVDARAAPLVPLAFRGRVSGVMAAYDHLGSEGRFSREDEELLQGSAASAATAVANAQRRVARRSNAIRYAVQRAGERHRGVEDLPSRPGGNAGGDPLRRVAGRAGTRRSRG